MNEDILHKPIVLVLNRHWQAINTRTPAQAFCQMATDAATGLDISADKMAPVKWADWLSLPVREGDYAVHTVYQPIRLPTVVVLSHFDKVPRVRPKLTARTIRERDGYRCQYTGRRLGLRDGSIDHVLPRSRGGQTTWENCVLADKAVNTQKGDRLPEEAGLKLLSEPVTPPERPVTLAIRNRFEIPEWEHFLKSLQ